MNPVRWKRSRLFKLTALGSLLILSYLSFLRSPCLESPYTEKKVEVKRDFTLTFLTSGKLGNFEPAEEPVVEGPGEGGDPYELPRDKKNERDDSLVVYGMNMAVSDDISLERRIPDTRMEECKHWNYPPHMGLKATVVIVFHNEGWSTLLRNVHTIIKRTPPEMLEEVLLVDDFSDKENLKSDLDNYIRRFQGKVRLIRNAEREGLIRTRTRGAEESRGDVVVFLDAHCEVNRNWLPPLLAPIYRDRTVMTVPVIDGIDHQNFQYRPVYSTGTNFRGIFEWGLYYKETKIPAVVEAGRPNKSAPYKSPTHAGGLFAIDRKYFLELGGYDPGLLGWGGENFELSFKIWQCGGSIEWVPCSRVGHVYRRVPYNFGKLVERRKASLTITNYKRVIEVWFDDKYKEFFYTRNPMARLVDHGDISKQLAIKEKLHCKSFQWFMDNVAPDMLIKYPELPRNLHWGELRNKGSSTCLDTMRRPAPTKMGLSSCHGDGNNQFQLARLNGEGQLGIGERCVEADKSSVKLIFCPMGKVDGPWNYDADTGRLKHKGLGKCLAVHPNSSLIILRECESDNRNIYYQWTWKPL